MQLKQCCSRVNCVGAGLMTCFGQWNEEVALCYFSAKALLLPSWNVRQFNLA